MKVVATLLNATRNMKIGNHQVIFKGESMYFIYHDSVICGVHPSRKVFFIDSSYNSQSTTRACNAYRKNLLAKGFLEYERNEKHKDRI